MRLIDADELVEKKTVTVYSTNGAITDIVPVGVIRYFPTIDPIHAAGGCYCRECDLWNDWDNLGKLGNLECSCAHWSSDDKAVYTRPNDFCSYGKPKKQMED